MTLGRRGFLQRLGVGLVAAPAAAKQLVDKAAADLAGVSLSGAGQQMAPPYGNPAGQSVGNNIGQPYDPRKALRHLLTDAAARDEYTSALFARSRNVNYIDLDLATKRSFSLAAKVTFQRQRIVARQIEDDTADEPLWQRPEMLIRKAASWFLG